MPDLEVVLVAIGDGGPISGMAGILKALKLSLRVIDIEPTGPPTLKASMDAGQVVHLDRVTSRVATMSCAETDPAVFAVVGDHVDEVVLVTDEQMQAAAECLWFEPGVAADLSGASAIAALQSRAVVLPSGARCGALICGAGPEGIIR